MNTNIEKIFKTVESGMNAHHSAVTAAYEDYRKKVAMVKEEAAYYKDEDGELSRRKAALIDINRQRIATADQRFADTVKVAAAQLRKELSENLCRPANPKLLDQLRTYAEFGLKMTHAELESYLELAGDNPIALKAVKAVAEQSGFSVTLPDDDFKKDLKTIEGMASVPSMWCDPEYLAEAMEVLPDRPYFRDDGSVSHSAGRPNSVYLLTRAGLHNSVAKELERISQKWGTRFVPEISELKPIEDPETGEIVSPEEQHAQAVAALVDGIDVESPFKGLEGGTDNSRAILEHYI